MKERRKRTRLQALAFFGGIGLAGLAVLIVALLVGGRLYLLSDSGRNLVTGFIQGRDIGRYGRINVEGVRGDLFSDFTIARVTVTDIDGVWLEAREVRVDWTYWPLLARRFHATNIEAGQVRLIRRPQVEPPTEPGGPQPLDIDIHRFSANVELLEGFSQEYGRWNLTGQASLPRSGTSRAQVNALSLNRPGDYLRAEASFGETLADLRVNLRANEAQGGPLAGSLGYSPDLPFSAVAVINGDVVHARVQTGEFTPLRVQGRYGDDGARISGFADFSGSDLLQPFAERIGRTARFGLVAIPREGQDGVQALGWRLISDNLNARAQGYIDTADQSSSDGVRFEVTTPSLTRLAGVPVAQGAAYVGTFRGGAQTWTIQGAASLTQADLASYRAARVSGPLNVSARDGRYAIDTDIRVAGGRGEGIVGALLGEQPRIRARASRATDGALLLERIDATGRALALSGSGGRTLVGGLNFRGEARITDAGAIRDGATGAFGGAIQASSARPGAPWSIRFDGRGNRLAVGLGELDRLLGPSPRLQLAGLLNQDRIELNQGVLTGQAGRASARGLIEPQGRLRLALDWNAQGPFEVGPVAIDGAMAGDGALTGTLAQPRADLTARFDRVAAGALRLTETNLTLSFRRGADASDGRIVVTSGSNYGPARASGNFFLGGDRVRLTDVDLDAGGVTAQGAIALSDNVPSSADLTFTARPGAFLAAGNAQGRVRLTEGGGDETAILDVQGRGIRIAGQDDLLIRTVSLSGRGTLERLPFTLVADVAGANPVQFDGTGVYSRVGTGQSVTLSGAGRVREIAFTTRAPAVIALNGDGRVARVDLAVGGGVLAGELRQDARAAIVDATLQDVELGTLAPDVRGRVTGQVSLRGTGDALAGSANLDLAGLQSVDAGSDIAVDGAINAVLADDVLTLRATAADTGSVRASADVRLPVEASAAPLRLAIARTRPMSGEISAQGQIQPIWDLFFGGERSLAGQIDAQATLAGTINAPRINGRLNLAQGRFRDAGSGVELNAVTLASRFDDTTALIETFTANDGGSGSVSGQGRIGLRQGSASTLRLELQRFRVIDNELAEARASGPIQVTRAADGNIRLAGTIDIDEATIRANPPGSTGIVRMDVVEINRPGGDPVEREEAATSGGPPIALDIRLRSPGGDVRVVGRGLNVELDVNAAVTGTVAQPNLTGTARIVRGDYEFAGRRFIFDPRGSIVLSTDPRRIRLDLAAVRDDPALTATIRVTGTAAAPQIALTSVPALPEDEILSQVLFGRSASQLSAFEAAQLAAGVASLAGGGGFDVIGNLRELAGLDRLSFGGEASALTIAGGRYLTDDIYLEVIGGGEAGTAVNVEWQVRRNVTISSKLGGQGESSLSIRWRRQAPQPGTGRTDRRPNRGR